MGLLLSFAFGFLPMLLFAVFVYWLDRYEKEPKVLLGAVFSWGAVIAAGIAFVVNSLLGMGIYLLTGSKTAEVLTTGSLIAPVVEESLKGIAVLLVFLVFRNEFDSVLDGIVYAAVTALGFAATENFFYIYTYGYAESGLPGLFYLAFVRVIMVGWQHPFFTAFTGIGLAIARMSKNALQYIAPIIGWGVAVFVHSLHNSLSDLFSSSGNLLYGSVIDWIGWIFMFAFILWAISREQNWIKQQLSEEVALGVITPDQYRVASSAWSQNAARLSALSAGRFRQTNRFYQLCAELAHKKHQRSLLGDENARYTFMIDQMRTELARLSPFAAA